MFETLRNSLRDHLPLWLMLTPVACAASLLVSRRMRSDAVRRTVVGKAIISLSLCIGMVVAYEPLKPTTTPEQFALFGQLERFQFRSSFNWIGETRTEMISRPTREGTLHDVEVLTRRGPDIRFETGIDGVSLWFVVLAVLASSVGLLQTTATVSRPSLIGWLLLESSLVGAFVALDVVLFVVCWLSCVMIVSCLLGQGGDSDRHEATPAWLKTQWLGAWLVALGLGGLVLAFGWLRVSIARPQPPLLFSIPEISAGIGQWTNAGDNLYLWTSISPWLFWLLVIGFTGPLMLAPLHRSFVNGVRSAPPALSIVLVAVVAKLGLFGWLRFVLPVFSDLVRQNSELLVTAFGLSSLLAAVLAFQQPDWRGRIALATCSSIGLTLMNLSTSTFVGLNGGVMRLLGHGLTVILLLWLLPEVGTSRTRQLAMRLSLFAWIGMPGLSGFVAEFLTPLSLVPHDINAATLGLATSGLIAWMWVRSERELAADSVKESHEPDPAAMRWGRMDHVVVTSLVALNVALGVAPQFVMNRMQPSLVILLPIKANEGMASSLDHDHNSATREH